MNLSLYLVKLSILQTDAVPILGSFLRKNQRALKLSTLVLLDTLVQNYSNAISIELLSKVRNERKQKKNGTIFALGL